MLLSDGVKGPGGSPLLGPVTAPEKHQEFQLMRRLWEQRTKALSD